MRALARLLPLCAWLAAVPACKEEAFALISVLSFSEPMAGVTQLRVQVKNGDDWSTLYYPRQPTEPMVLDAIHPVTFSVEFSPSRGGTTTFAVEPIDANDDGLGYGQTEATIEKEEVFEVTVRVVPGAVGPVRGQDGGASSDGGGASSLVCDPYQPAAACGDGRTCGLLCPEGQPPVGMCYVAGPGAPGQACATNNDCSPGSQCFTFSAVACQVRTCLRFCQTDDACGEAGAYCNLPFQCGSTFTACSRPCDPTGPGTTGCAAGLACFVYSDETTDCACPGLGVAGAACTQSQGCDGVSVCAGCAPGLSCVVPTGGAAGAGICRPICSLEAAACPTGTTCRAFAGSTRARYGFCE